MLNLSTFSSEHSWYRCVGPIHLLWSNFELSDDFVWETILQDRVESFKPLNLEYDVKEEVCDSNTTEEESDKEFNEVQAVVSDYERTLNLAATAPRILFTLLEGRKITHMLIPT